SEVAETSPYDPTFVQQTAPPPRPVDGRRRWRRGLLYERRIVRRGLSDFRSAEVVGRVVKFFVRRELYDGRALPDERRVVVLTHELQPGELARDTEHVAQLRDVHDRHEEDAVQ